MKPSQKFLWLALFLATLPHTISFAQASRKPNIIFVLADDMGYRDLSAFGQQARQTPHLDRLAHNGMIFNHAYAGAAMCAASRAVLMTGMHLGHSRVRENASLRGGQDNLQRFSDGCARALAGRLTAAIPVCQRETPARLCLRGRRRTNWVARI
jgi:hypothetical protein